MAARNPAREARLRSMLMLAAQNYGVIAMFTRSTDDDEAVARANRVLYDETKWGALAAIIFGGDVPMIAPPASRNLAKEAKLRSMLMLVGMNLSAFAMLTRSTDDDEGAARFNAAIYDPAKWEVIAYLIFGA